MDWRQQRRYDIEKQMLDLVKLLGQCEQKLMYESDPPTIGKLESQIIDCKKRISDYESDLEVYGQKQEAQRSLAINMANITFEDMNFVITAFLRQRVNTVDSQSNFSPTKPEEKMLKNSLTSNIRFLLDDGLAKADKVRHLIENNAKINFPDVPERLKTALNTEYTRLKGEGIQGDDLFNSLQNFVSCNNPDLRWQLAGLAILCYFFETCDVFEP